MGRPARQAFQMLAFGASLAHGLLNSSFNAPREGTATLQRKGLSLSSLPRVAFPASTHQVHGRFPPRTRGWILLLLPSGIEQEQEHDKE
jgi:hypothetical protein